jgi:hypothetical protein
MRENRANGFVHRYSWIVRLLPRPAATFLGGFFLTILLAPPILQAQDATVFPFQPPSSIGVHFHSQSPALFEGTVLPHFFLLKSSHRPGDPENAHRWGLLFTPGVRVRLTRERPHPVRTPSYLPRIDFQRLFVRDHGSTVNVWEWHAGAGHHSNGQSGCLFQDQTEAGGVCVPETYAGDSEDRRVNNRSGNFSTNDLRSGFNFRHNLVNNAGQTTQDWSAGLEYQRQARTDSDLRKVYSQNRVNGRVSVAWKDRLWTSRLKAEMNVTFAIDRPLKKVARWSFSPEVAWFPWSRSGLGMFVRLYHGQDYFNLHFADNISHRIQVGVQFEQDGFLKFSPR